MSVTISNTSSKVVQLSDIGDSLIYDNIVGQKYPLAPGSSIILRDTDEVKLSLESGDIKKFSTAGLINAVVSGSALILPHSIGIPELTLGVGASLASADNLALALSVDTITGYVTNVNDLIQIGNLKMPTGGTSIQMKNFTTGFYDEVIKYLNSVGNVNSLLLGGVNTNGVVVLNDKSFKGMNTFGTGLNLVKIDTSNNCVVSDVSAQYINFVNGGVNPCARFAGGKLQIGCLSTVMAGEIDIVDVQTDPNSGTGGIGIASYRNSDIWGSYVYGIRYRGSANVPAPCQLGDSLMEFGCLGWDGANALGGGELMWVVDGVVAAGVIPSRAELYVTNAAGVTTLGMKIDKTLQVEVYGDIKLPGDITDGVNASNAAEIKSAVDSKYKSVNTCTLGNAVVSTIVNDANVVAGSKIFLQATSASAAGIGTYISAIVNGVSFTISHNNSAGTETFDYMIF